ncbi:hypothetical protein BSR28_01985 [Boudabousia liubingyangii]|uniref:heparinase II/III domain-containing protein n=1 Tax=Boudabousia liubingyangii TaxID=1921764 RepID=UPI00093D1D87|nr:heparinase II/III family protein [Boudabousia liubingyangii]OKL48487.1 hypothetical protein BSR28_01985 [Boudabousia liubingyangii]
MNNASKNTLRIEEEISIGIDESLKSAYLKFREKDTFPNWTFNFTDSKWIIQTPNKVSFEVPKNFEWTILPSEQYQSTLMWIYSLNWLQAYLQQSSNPDSERVFSIIRSFRDFVSSPLGEERLGTLTSRDHMTAELIRSLCYLLIKIEDSDLDQVLLELLTKFLNWSLNPENIANNNHGMMLSNAILHSCHLLVFSQNKEVFEYALMHLKTIVSNAFDSSGLCVENTPSYHAFYIRYIEALLKEAEFITKNGSEYIHFLEEILSKAKISLAKTVLPNGLLPPLGDGHLSSVNRDLGLLNDGDFFSQESGFYCNRTGNLYFSFKCGQSSITHKHSDDNSIFLFYKDKPIILDCGFYNYDWQDPVTQCVKSQRGHSGPYWRKFDPLYPATLYKQGAERVKTQIVISRDKESTCLSGISTIDDQYKTIRTIDISSPSKFRINDKFVGPDNEEAVVRFLINPDFSINIQGTSIYCENTDVTLEFNFDFSPKINLTKGNYDPSESGWYANDFGIYSPCWCIEIAPSAQSNSLNTSISLTPKNKV